MIYFLHGTDTTKSRKKMHEILGQLSVKRPNSEIFKLNSENWSDLQFEELVRSFGLFEKKYIVVLNFLLSNKNTKDFILDNIKEMEEAEHWFLIIDGKLDQATIKKIEKSSYKVQKFEKPIGSEKEKDNPVIFTITDKLLSRDKKKLWIVYVDLINQKIPVEEIHGLIFWAVKNMIITSHADSQKESGLTPFQYSKALSGSRNYKTEELQKMSSNLVEMIHKVRSGEGDLGVMLEKWILTI